MSGGVTTHGVHLVVERADVDRLRRLAVDAGRGTAHVDLGDVRDAQQLFAVLARDLAIPHPVSGFDALLGLLASLDEWLEGDKGFLLVLDRLDGLWHHAPAAFADLVGILPNVCDRWRSGGTPFSVVLTGSLPTLVRARDVLDVQNAAMARAALQPYDIGTRTTVVLGPPTGDGARGTDCLDGAPPPPQ